MSEEDEVHQHETEMQYIRKGLCLCSGLVMANGDDVFCCVLGVCVYASLASCLRCFCFDGKL